MNEFDERELGKHTFEERRWAEYLNLKGDKNILGALSLNRPSYTFTSTEHDPVLRIFPGFPGF